MMRRLDWVRGGGEITFPPREGHVGQIALPEHAKKGKRQTHLHGPPQVPQASGDGSQLMQEVRKDVKMPAWWGPHGDICHPAQTSDRESIQCSWGQADFLVQEPDPRDIVENTLCGYKPPCQEGDVITLCGNRRVDEL